MCACQYDSGSTPPASPQFLDIEDYYSVAYTMGDRQIEGLGCHTPGEEELYAQLEQKDRDLTLAAELGKALLEKNAELERMNEKLMEEYTHKLELLEQEKHELHLKLEKTEAEYENTVKELQFDISQLRHELQSQQHQSHTDDKERLDIIRELTLHNERLREESQRAGSREDQLSTEVHSLREQMMSRRSSMHLHISQLESLQEEITLLSHRKLELERRIAVIVEEKEAICCNLEESQEKIMVLEKQNKDKEQQLQDQHRDLVELQETNVQLQAQLHHMSNNIPLPCNHSNDQSQITCHDNNQRNNMCDELSDLENSQSQSLFHELSAVNSFHGGEVNDSQSLFDELSHFHSNQGQEQAKSHQMSLSEMMEEDDFECDDEIISGEFCSSGGATCNSSVFSDTQFIASFQNSSSVMDIDSELQTDLVQAYQQIKQMCREFRRNQQRPKSHDQEEENEIPKPQRLMDTLGELRELMYDIMSPKSMSSRESQVDFTEDGIFCVNELQKHIHDLQSEVSGAQEDLERVRMELRDRDQKLNDKSEEMRQLTNKVKLTMQHEELVHVQGERDRLQMVGEDPHSRRDIVEQAKKDRDLAIEKQTKMELELAKTKMEVLRLNNRLMETIQQKVSLSQQLEQWQGDVEKLLDSEVDKRLQALSSKEEIVEHLSKQIKIKKSKSESFLK